jgi:hypothetical protein
MSKRVKRIVRLCASILPALLCAAPPVIRRPPIAAIANPKVPQLQRVSAISPLRFEPNVGQAGPEVRYIARGGGYMLLLTRARPPHNQKIFFPA